MRKRMLYCVLGLFMALLLIPGCSGNVDAEGSTPGSEEQPADVLPLMIMVEDTLYQRDVGVLDPSVTIEDSQILGHVTKNLFNEIPSQNGEGCFVEEGTPYSRCPLPEYPEGMVVYIDHQWQVFLPVDQAS